MSRTTFFIEDFTNDEKGILLRYFTNVDKPVFGLINMPEVVKGALFARYSRTNKSLRRLFLDEFYKESKIQSSVNERLPADSAGTDRADQLFDKVFVEYGDDSVAQLGGAHLACEQASNLLAKIIERGRLAAYLEQSTRYVYYNNKVGERYNFIQPSEIAQSPLSDEYESCINMLFDTYTDIAEKLVPRLKNQFPKSESQSVRAWETTLKAKACDIVRGLLPASTRTNIGIFASGQAYEMMLLKMFASDSIEVVDYANMMLEELRKIIPSFLKRVDLEDRGKLWSKYLSGINKGMEELGVRAFDDRKNQEVPSSVELVDWDREALDKVVAAALYEFSQISDIDLIEYCRSLSHGEKENILRTYFGERSNRRHKPGRALETTFYRFDIVSDYGAFRDLQRHRMLTVQWQKLCPANGYKVPDELNEHPDLKMEFKNAIEQAGTFHKLITQSLGAGVAQYVVPFAYNIRYMFNVNLREAIHLIELRSQKQGHISYRKICLDMYSLIEQNTNHSPLLEVMKYIDFSFYNLSREDAENKIDAKLTS